MNLRNRTDIKLVSKEKGYLKWISKPSYMSQKIVENNSVAIRKSKVTLTFNKSVYVGMWILHLSKGLMYDFHCDYIKNKLCINSRLLFTDTDILMYEIKTKYIFESFSQDKEIFCFSNYSTESKYYDDLVVCKTNNDKLVIRKMKDERGGVASK